MTAIPPYLRPKATHLPEGHDDTLDPAEPPTDAATRSVAPNEWPVASLATGGVDPPDAPLAPPPTDPALRQLAPFEWPADGAFSPNRPVLETVSPLGDLDPDIAMWQQVIVSIWPFSGPPTVGIWPRGWVGIDNTANMYICSQGGQPGTWTLVATGATGVASFNGRTGAVVPGPADYLAVPTGGLPGAPAATRYVGGTTAGAPSSGTFAAGDFVVDQTGVIWICTTGGTPGTWVQAGGPNLIGVVGGNATALQLGTSAVTTDASGHFTITFAVPFPVNCLGVIGNVATTNPGLAVGIQWFTITTSNATGYAFSGSSALTNTNLRILWMAFGS